MFRLLPDCIPVISRDPRFQFNVNAVSIPWLNSNAQIRTDPRSCLSRLASPYRCGFDLKTHESLDSPSASPRVSFCTSSFPPVVSRSSPAWKTMQLYIVLVRSRATPSGTSPITSPRDNGLGLQTIEPGAGIHKYGGFAPDRQATDLLTFPRESKRCAFLGSHLRCFLQRRLPPVLFEAMSNRGKSRQLRFVPLGSILAPIKWTKSGRCPEPCLAESIDSFGSIQR